MQIDKTVSLNAPIQDVWNTIMDVEAMAQCFPGLESVEKVDENTYRSLVKVTIARISAKFDLLTKISEMEAPIHLATVTEGKASALGATVTQKQTLELKSLDDETTQVLYRGDVVVTGKLAMLGQRAIRAKAEQMADVLAVSFVNLLQSRTVGNGQVQPEFGAQVE